MDSRLDGRVLVLVEDDAGDTLLVTEMLHDVAPNVTLVCFASLRAALAGWPAEAECALLDLGLPDAIVVGLACREPDAGTVRRQLVAHFPDAVLEETGDSFASRWRRDVPAFVVDFGLSEEPS